ncbi:hypothetical protein NL676_024242 [Syzygium grande]|nr:hypothetical protein NL676_024242 [Syzygium grande]
MSEPHRRSQLKLALEATGQAILDPCKLESLLGILKSATRIRAHLAGVGRCGTNDCKDVNGRVRSEAQKALKGKGVVESSNGSGGNSLTQGQHQPETSSTATPILNPDDISSLGLNAEEAEPNTEVPQSMCIGKFTIPDARTRDGPLESLPPCSGVVVDKNMPYLLTKLEELSSRETDMANLETWWRKVKRIKGEYWSVVQALREGRPLSTSQLSRVEELSKEVEEILLRDRFQEESKTLAGCNKTVPVANIPPPSVPAFNQEHLRTLIESTSQESWSYAIFWKSSYDNLPPTAAALSSSLLEHRNRVLCELSLLIGEPDPKEEVADTEWFFLVSMTESFMHGHGLPGQALLSLTTTWVSGADRFASCGCERAKQGMDFGLQNMVCIPAIGGVVELGSTELISGDQI